MHCWLSMRDKTVVDKLHWISDQPWPLAPIPQVMWHPISVIQNMPVDYNTITLTRMNSIVSEDHCLIVQTDGYVVNPDAWTDEFLQYDYIGPAFNTDLIPRPECAVGNGGFTLRSKRLLETIDYCAIQPTDRVEDVVICWDWKPYLEVQFGIRFAPIELADQWAIDINDNCARPVSRDLPWLGKSFGFHGRYQPETWYNTELRTD
jgi:Protein of unknown function (DUF5672)